MQGAAGKSKEEEKIVEAEARTMPIVVKVFEGVSSKAGCLPFPERIM